MKKLFLSLLSAFVFLCLSTAASAAVIGFDNLGGLLDSDGYYYNETIQTGFETGGFQFDMSLMSQSAYQNDYSNTSDFPSQSIAVYSNDASSDNNLFDEITVYKTDGSMFNFISAYFGGFTLGDTTPWFATTELTIEGFSGTTLKDSITFDPLNIGFQKNDVGLYGIDKLVFTAAQVAYDYSYLNYTNKGDGSYWMMDDFEYTNPVPEPTTMLLFGLGLLGLVGVRVSRKKQK